MAVDVRINGADYPDVPAIDVPKTNNGGTATFYDTSGDTATAGNVLSGKTFHTASGSKTGSLRDRGIVTLTVSDLNSTYSGSGYYSYIFAQISDTEKVKIVPENIKSGVSILGVAGSLEAGVDFDDMFNNSNPVTIESSPSADNTDKECYGFYAGFNLDLTGYERVYDRAFFAGNIRNLVAPDLIHMGSYAFANNDRLNGTLTLPVLTSIGREALANSSYNGVLSGAKFPVLPALSEYLFYGQQYFNDIWLGYNGVVSLPASNATTVFTGCGRYSFEGNPYLKIHVPAAQLSAYLADNDWNLVINALQSDGVNVSIVGDYE